MTHDDALAILAIALSLIAFGFTLAASHQP